ncbi:MAG: phage integrase N-terminal SAM-like domain-containing protein [Candidatus Marinimicrobia bacterium]|nr:phage integrase N-terminal SAM-like domain-containing protein [Candidatus Neomarinimicrobiota bacterium]
MVRRVVGQVDQFRYLIRTKHYSLSTENTYVDWVKRFIFFHNKQHPATLSNFESGLP